MSIFSRIKASFNRGKHNGQWRKEDSNLYAYAENEVRLAGLLDDEGMYGDMLGKAVLELVEVFARQGHSGMSASVTLEVFNLVANFKPLTPIDYSDLTQWNEVGEGVYQHTRRSTTFSNDGLKTWYDLEEDPKIYHPIYPSQEAEV